MTAVLFDMDGVLVDVSRSYREAVRQTVCLFSGHTVSDERIRFLKNKGGYNNDWDLTRHLLKEKGFDLTAEEVIDTFQNIYLGRSFDGLIRNEKWLLRKDLLEDIRRRFKTGIVTGRPRRETEFVLARFSAADAFSVVVTMDDLPEDKNKPDPAGILAALKALEERKGFYFGDTVDDMKAALRASITPVGVTGAGPYRKEQSRILRENGAAAVLKHINELMGVLA